MQQEENIQECMDHITESPEVKQPCSKESPQARKKSKTTKALEKEFIDSNKLANNVPTDAWMDMITEHTTMLGDIQAYLKALQG